MFNLIIILLKNRFIYQKILFPSPRLIEFVAVYSCAFFLKKITIRIFVRRTSSSFLRKILFERLLRKMSGYANIAFLSDNQELLKFLKLKEDKGFFVPIPPRKSVSTDELKLFARKLKVKLNDPETVIYGLVGRASKEKGIDLYEHFINEILKSKKNKLIIQLTNDVKLLKTLSLKFRTYRDRIFLIGNALTKTDYDSMINLIDVFLLPYSVNSYGSGTSAVAQEAIYLGKTVLAHPIDWLKENFDEKDNVFFYENLLEANLNDGKSTNRTTSPVNINIKQASSDFHKKLLEALE